MDGQTKPPTLNELIFFPEENVIYINKLGPGNIEEGGSITVVGRATDAK